MSHGSAVRSPLAGPPRRLSGFHAHAGLNIEFSNHRRTARRTQCFDQALIFSSRPINRNEIFTFVIDEQQTGWIGHLRLGLTAHSPDAEELRVLPKYALPDLKALGNVWVYHTNLRHLGPANPTAEATAAYSNLPKIGNEIGVTFTEKGELIFLVNGHRSTAVATSLPAEQQLWVVVDVYGQTRQVTFLSYSNDSILALRTLCLRTIANCLASEGDAETLPLPRRVIADVRKVSRFKTTKAGVGQRNWSRKSAKQSASQKLSCSVQ